MSDAYQKAGVDIEAGNALVDRIKPVLATNRAVGLLPNLGGFAALARVPEHYQNPVLALATDGVGTKLDLLLQYDRLDTVGQDLVAMCVNDLIVYGAQPALFLDYYATEKLDVNQAEVVIKSIAGACDLAGCALVGGETAEMPGFYPGGKFDLAGFCVGWAEEADILKPEHVQAGDVMIGLPSSGPHSNGYSLIRAILRNLPSPPDRNIIDALVAPTRIYARSVLPHVAKVHAMAHITGGGFKDNLPRAFSAHLEAQVDMTSWQRPAIFEWLQRHGNVSEVDMLTTFNCGIAMILFVDQDLADEVLSTFQTEGEVCVRLGSVQPRAAPRKPGTLIVAQDEFTLV
ncbi:MAG: phosphoribosylformylglycinamidine cyclo-ligase [Gammaproteobacteria bacterium]|nr:phosphoribosylformylglycinamidine cyclo-ligase [Gammaproteobacteria bacterium]